MSLQVNQLSFRGGLIGLTAGWLSLGSVFADEGASRRFEFSRPQMGTSFRILLYTAAPDRAQRAADAAFGRIEELNGILSNYETDSELSRLGHRSGDPSWIPVSDDLYRIVTHAQRLSARTDGAFDLTVGPLSSAWRHARRQRQFPDPDQLEQFRHRVNWRWLEWDAAQRKVRLTVPKMRLDPGGIAKGDALDQALLVLKRHGVASALVEGGGDVAVSAAPPGRRGWRVRLTPDRSTTPEARYLLLADHAAATSGDLEQAVTFGGKRYSHIVDPRTGIGLTDRRLVTVIAKTGIVADSLATAISVLELGKIESLLARYPGSHCRVDTHSGTGSETRRFGRFNRFLDSPATTD